VTVRRPTPRPRVSAIAALDENRVIGGPSGGLPWHIPEDSRRFRAITSGHPIIFGRVTFEEFSTPMAACSNIVVTRQRSYSVPGCRVAHSLQEALAIARTDDPDEIFIGGGAALYQDAVLLCDRLYLTLVKGHHEGAAKFPDYSAFGRVIGGSTTHGTGEYQYEFTTVERTR
jgi:dihydrofolate reductase